MKKRLQKSIALLAALVLISVLQAGLASASPESDENRFVDLINRERTAAGLPALYNDDRLRSIARNHSSRMAASATIFHNSNLANEVQGDWTRLGENVGMGSNVDDLHRAFMASGSHRANIQGDFNVVGVGIVVNSGTIYVTQVYAKMSSLSIAMPSFSDPSATGGYRFVATDGGVFAFGNAQFYGSTGNIRLARPIISMSSTPSGAGYWLLASDGGMFAFGDAPFVGSAAGTGQTIVAMAPTPSGKGYWLVADNGSVFSFGDAAFYGSASGQVSQPIVGMGATPTGNGYWLAAADGGIFAFGDAGFHGSTGGVRLTKPIVGMAATPSGQGYWLVASDGGIFAFGDAGFYGSTGGIRLNQPVVGILSARSGDGYWIVATDGGVFAFGNAGFYGSTGNVRLNQPIIEMGF